MILFCVDNEQNFGSFTLSWLIKYKTKNIINNRTIKKIINIFFKLLFFLENDALKIDNVKIFKNIDRSFIIFHFFKV